MNVENTTDRMTPAQLKNARKVLGMTGEALAASLNVRPDTVRKWESGKELIPHRVGSEIDRIAFDRRREIATHFTHTAPRTATLSIKDLFGDTRTVVTMWIPADVTWMVPAFENMGHRLFAFEDEPPVYLKVSANHGTAVLKTSFFHRDGHIFELDRVDTVADLEPGAFVILFDSDDED